MCTSSVQGSASPLPKVLGDVRCENRRGASHSQRWGQHHQKRQPVPGMGTRMCFARLQYTLGLWALPLHTQASRLGMETLEHCCRYLSARAAAAFQSLSLVPPQGLLRSPSEEGGSRDTQSRDPRSPSLILPRDFLPRLKSRKLLNSTWSLSLFSELREPLAPLSLLLSLACAKEGTRSTRSSGGPAPHARQRSFRCSALMDFAP